MSIKSILYALGKRIIDSNNRALATLFGCTGGFVVGTIVVIQHNASIAILGNPATLPYQILAYVLQPEPEAIFQVILEQVLIP